MALKWNYQSTSITQALYATGWRDMVRVGSASPLTLTTGPSGTFGGTYLDMTAAPNILWPGQDNAPVGSAAISILWRLIPTASGAPAANTGIFQMSNSRGSQAPFGGWSFYISTAGKLVVTGGSAASGLNYLNDTTFGTALTFVNNQPTDIWFCWDGTASANAIEVWQAQNGDAATLVATLTSGAAGVAEIRAAISDFVSLAPSDGLGNSRFHINEIAIFDTKVVPSSYGARSGFITSTAFEGYGQADPGVGNVLAPGSGGPANYIYQGLVKVGTYVPPAPVASDLRLGVTVGSVTGTLNLATAANIKHGVTQDNGAITGTYTGADLWTAFTAGQIVLGQSANQNGSTVTGTAVTAAAATTKHGVTANDGTGSYRGADLWTTFTAGQIVLGQSSLQNGVTVTGTAIIAAAATTQLGVAANDGTGTYTGSDLWVAFTPGQVVAGQAALQNGATVTGTAIVAVAATTVVGTQANDGPGSTIAAAASTTKHGVVANDGMGTYRGADLWTALPIDEVSFGVAYTANGTALVGTRQTVTNIMASLDAVLTDAPHPIANAIVITQGDTFRLPFRLKDSPTSYHDLTSAILSLEITAVDGTALTFDASHFTVDDQGTTPGGGVVTLTPTETATLGVGQLKEILIRISQNAGVDILTWRKPRVLEVLPPTPIDGE